MNTDEVRAKFEIWLMDNGFSQCDKAKINGDYVVPSVQLAWLSYQQATKEGEAEIDRLKADIRCLHDDIQGAQ